MEPTPRALRGPQGAQERSIGEELLAKDAPRVRYQLVQRLETMWRACEPFLAPPPVDEAGVPLWRPDPRYIEAGIRITDRMARFYRLDQSGTDEDPVIGGARPETRELVARALLALEARMAEGGSQDRGTAL